MKRKTYKIHVTHADNEIVIYVNNSEALRAREDLHDGRPPMDVWLDFSDRLQPFPFQNEIRVVGINDAPDAGRIPDGGPHNPWQFTYEIFSDDHIIHNGNAGGGGNDTPAGTYYDTVHKIQLSRGEE